MTMRKTLTLLAVLAAIPAGALALSATAQMSVAAAIPQTSVAPIDLEAIPVKPVTDHFAVTGVAADDEDGPVAKGVGGRHLKLMSDEEDGFAAEDEDRETD